MRWAWRDALYASGFAGTCCVEVTLFRQNSCWGWRDVCLAAPESGYVSALWSGSNVSQHLITGRFSCYRGGNGKHSDTEPMNSFVCALVSTPQSFKLSLCCAGDTCI